MTGSLGGSIRKIAFLCLRQRVLTCCSEISFRLRRCGKTQKDSQIDEQAVKLTDSIQSGKSLQQKDPELGKRRFKGAVVCSDLTLCAVVVAGYQSAGHRGGRASARTRRLGRFGDPCRMHSQGPSFKSLEMCSQMPQFLFRTTFEDPFQLQIGD